jgi:hypothetical protein
MNLMNKQLLIFLMCFISGNTFAQIDKIVGNWSEIMRIRIDTTSSGMEVIQKDWEAYKKGHKTLDKEEYTTVNQVFPHEKDKLKFEIKKEDDFLAAKNVSNFKEKISLNADFEDYTITIKGYLGESRIYKVKYDANTDKLLFLNRYDEIYYAYERKE